MKRKIKRFSNGGMDDYDSSDDAKNLMAAAARESAEANAPKPAAAPVQAPPMKMASFGEAFREARNRGDKTFEYMGKKYTTEMAGEKKAAAPATPKTNMQRRADKQTEARNAMVAARKPSIFKTLADMASNPSNPRLRRERLSMQDIDANMKKGGKVKTYKSGGSVKSSASSRADGIAMRGKTRGKMV